MCVHGWFVPSSISSGVDSVLEQSAGMHCTSPPSPVPSYQETIKTWQKGKMTGFSEFLPPSH